MRQHPPFQAMHVVLAASILVAATVLPGIFSGPAQASDPGFRVYTADPLTAGQDGAIVVEATTAEGNVKYGYVGTISFTTNAVGSSSLPGSYTFRGGRDGGIHVFQDGLDIQGPQSGVTVTVSDTANPALTGTSAPFEVRARPMLPASVQTRTAAGRSSTPAVTLSSAPTPGDLEVAFISSSQGIPSLSGWATIRADDNLAAFYRVVPADASATVTADAFAGAAHWTINVNEYANVFTRSPIAGAGIVGDKGSTTGIGSANAAIRPPSALSGLGGSDVMFIVALYERNGSSPGHDGTPTQAHVTSDLTPGDGLGACSGPDLGFGDGWTVRSHHPAPVGTTDNLLTTFEQRATCPVPNFTSVRTGWNWPDATQRSSAPNHSTATIILALRGTG
jgi:hypothetical protein